MTQTIAVVRHAPYETLDELWKNNTQRAMNKWARLVTEMGIPRDVSDILIVSSSAPRAVQTAEALRAGMGLPDTHIIHVSESLWKDDLGHQGNIEQALAFIQTLPNALFMVVVTHLDLVWLVAARLGSKESYVTPHYLEWPIFKPHISEEKVASSSHETVSEDSYYEWEHSFNVVLMDELRTIHVVDKITQLQKQAGIWQQIQDVDEASYQFLVPKSILPTGDLGYSMSGWYDHEGIFPIQITFHTPEEIGEIEKWKFALIPEIPQIEAMEWIFGKLENTWICLGCKKKWDFCDCIPF